jgi:sugar lactone lactonase YvrE
MDQLMNKYLATTLIAATLALTACGGGGGGKSTPAPQAELTLLAGAVDATGNVDATGSAARFRGLMGLSVDAQGNVFVIDNGTCIRKITPAGVTTTFASVCSYGTGTDPIFAYPVNTAVDSAGNLYVTDVRFWKITPAGVASLVPGSGAPHQWDGHGPTFGTPWRGIDVAVDASGNLLATYSGTNPDVMKYSSTGGASVFTTLDMPGLLAVDGAGNVYVTDSKGIQKITPAGVITTVAQGLGNIWGMVSDRQGTLYISDHDNGTIRSVSPSGAVTTVVAKVGSSGPGAKLLPAGPGGPGDLAIDANGVLYVCYGAAVFKIKLPN